MGGEKQISHDRHSNKTKQGTSQGTKPQVNLHLLSLLLSLKANNVEDTTLRSNILLSIDSIDGLNHPFIQLLFKLFLLRFTSEEDKNHF